MNLLYEYFRMCTTKANCGSCPFWDDGHKCIDFIMKHPDEAERIVREWANTNFQRITANPEALAAWIIESQKRAPSVLWCHDDHGCADLDEDFKCTDELQARCIVDWLNSAREE